MGRSGDEAMIGVPGALSESGFGGADGVKAGSIGRDVIGDLTLPTLDGEERLGYVVVFGEIVVFGGVCCC